MMVLLSWVVALASVLLLRPVIHDLNAVLEILFNASPPPCCWGWGNVLLYESFYVDANISSSFNGLIQSVQHCDRNAYCLRCNLLGKGRATTGNRQNNERLETVLLYLFTFLHLALMSSLSVTVR
uniref:Putative secreted protein n=1 Tax=Anopheles triannulatus TaxID=58253 RepID=A0A2M4B4V5_9DIPT